MAIAPHDVDEVTAPRLVEAHCAGDRDAFAAIVRSHYPTLLACARQRLGNVHDAEDAVHETLLRAMLAFHRFGATGDWRVGAWLNTILIHVCADLRTRQRPTVPLDDWLLDAASDPRAVTEDNASDPVAMGAIADAIAHLPDQQRRAFELRLVDGLDYGEVAGRMAITEVNARALVHRARRALTRGLKSTAAVSGVLAAAPGLFTGSVRAALRRVFSGPGGETVRAAGSQAASVAGDAVTTSAPAVSTGPVGTGMQILAQVSATPVAQAAVASAAGTPAKSSVIFGIVASLATAGGLAAPAAIAATRPAPSSTRNAARPASALPAPLPAPQPASTGTPAPAASTASSPGATTTAPPSTMPASRHFVTPAWVTLAATATAYRVPSPSTSTASSPTAGSTTSSTHSSGTTSPSKTGSAATTTPSTQPVSSAPSASGSTSPGATATAPVQSTPSASGATGTRSAHTSGTSTGSSTGSKTQAVGLASGLCTGVTGFSGVSAPTTLPAVSTATLDAIMSTGALALDPQQTSPSFAGTALVKATGSTTQPVHVKVGTCLAEGGSILAVDMTGSTGDEIQLVGALVSQPAAASTGSASGEVAYLFRGNVTQIAGTAAPGGRLPWNLPSSFVAEVQVQHPASTGTLTVVFLQPQTPPVSASTTSTTTSSSTSTPSAATGLAPTAGSSTRPAAGSTATGASGGTGQPASTTTPGTTSTP